jgi:hypothetical protein
MPVKRRRRHIAQLLLDLVGGHGLLRHYLNDAQPDRVEQEIPSQLTHGSTLAFDSHH